jgi:hypothetical protein
MDLLKAHEELNSEITDIVPVHGDVRFYPNEEFGFRFVYNTDHWENAPNQG